MKKTLFFLTLLVSITATAWAAPLDERVLVGMMDDIIAYYDGARVDEESLLKMIPEYEENKEKPQYQKLLFLFDTHQKITTSLNNLIDILYIYLKLERYDDEEINVYIQNRVKNNIVFLNNMLYFLTNKNQALELDKGDKVQTLYQKYLVDLTTLLYDLNRSLVKLQD
jgi:hypothetical protein